MKVSLDSRERHLWRVLMRAWSRAIRMGQDYTVDIDGRICTGLCASIAAVVDRCSERWRFRLSFRMRAKITALRSRSHKYSEYLWPTTKLGAAYRANFCKRQVKLLEE